MTFPLHGQIPVPLGSRSLMTIRARRSLVLHDLAEMPSAAL
jgi:hypothetical protein